MALQDDAPKQPEPIEFYGASSSAFASEAAGEFVWRLPLTCIISGAVVFGAAASFYESAKSVGFIASWLVICMLQVGLLRTVGKPRSARVVFFCMFGLAFSALAWWSLLPIFGVGSQALANFLFAYLILTLGAMPWPHRMALALSCILVSICLALLVCGQASVLVTLAWLILCLISLRLAALNYLNLTARAALSFLSRYCESPSASALTSIQLLAHHTTFLADSRSVLISYGTDTAETISAGRRNISTVDQVYILGMIEKASKQQEGVLRFSEFGAQFLPAFMDWFGVKPWSVFFLRLTAVIDNRETTVLIWTPISLGTHLAGVGRSFRALLSVSSIVRMSLNAARNRFLSSDVLLASQRSVSEREEELNQIVHLVNNVAQDMSVHCDNAHHVVESLPWLDAEAQKERELKGSIEALESSARNLSISVSDIKLLKELLRPRQAGRLDTIDVAAVLEDVEKYAHSRARRKGEALEFENLVPSETGVRVASHEFLETALRLLLKIASKRISTKGIVKFQAVLEEDWVVFRISDNGGAPNIVEIRALLQGAENNAGALYEPLRAVNNLADLSQGKFTVTNGSAQFPHVMAFSLRRATMQSRTVIVAGQWALFVDDNPQVTTFYARVAEALGLKYFTAASVLDAEKIVEHQGRPRLVITDIHLGESSGLDLVLSLRQKFGDTLPVIVVSGETPDVVEEKVKMVGASRYLTKPVGRRRLFAEIREILAS